VEYYNIDYSTGNAKKELILIKMDKIFLILEDFAFQM
jgi:hypothetical protein